MVTDQDLREALAEAVDDPAAEKFMLGLSDRALAEAGVGSWWRRPIAGKRRRWVSGVAVGTAFAVAAAVGVLALGGEDDSSVAPTSLVVPGMPSQPVGLSAVTEFTTECFSDKPKLDMSYVWDPAAQQYRGSNSTAMTVLQPSPDGKRALVQDGMAPEVRSWAVADWSDAVAGHVKLHPLAGAGGLHWTADGKEVVSDLKWDVAKSNGGTVLTSRSADFYDPASGRRLASVPIPQPVLTMVASGQWSLQEFQGDEDSVQFPLLSADGDRLEYLDVLGTVVRTLTLQEGLPGNVSTTSELTESAQISPDGRYLSEQDGSVLAVFDLQAAGKRVGWMDVTAHLFTGWTGDHQIVDVVDEKELSLSGSRGQPIAQAGHSPLYTVLTPQLTVIQQERFVLPNDPKGACATWPISWGPAGQFPGAYVP